MTGCCTACRGYGGTQSGPCSDCYGTGCAHPDPCESKSPPGRDRTADLCPSCTHTREQSPREGCQAWSWHQGRTRTPRNKHTCATSEGPCHQCDTSTGRSWTRIKAGVRLPSDGDSMGWLWLYGEALSGEHGPWWQAVAERHTPSGRTDGTSWQSWRDDALAADVSDDARAPLSTDERVAAALEGLDAEEVAGNITPDAAATLRAVLRWPSDAARGAT